MYEESKATIGFDDSTRVEDYDTLITWVTERLNLLGYPNSCWLNSGDSSNNAIINFITGDGPKTLSVIKVNDSSTKDFNVQLHCMSTANEVSIQGLVAYLIRSTSASLSKENIHKEIQFGSVSGAGLSINTFERVMKSLVEKQIADKTQLSSNYHRYGYIDRCCQLFWRFNCIILP